MSPDNSRTRRPRYTVTNLLLLTTSIALASGWWASVNHSAAKLDMLNTQHRQRVRDFRRDFQKKLSRQRELTRELLGDVRGRSGFIQQYDREKVQLYRELYQRAETQEHVVAAQDVSTRNVHIRNCDVQFTSTPPTIDGTVSQGEWDTADPPSGDWRQLRREFTEVDYDYNRFRILYDDEHLYILYETNHDGIPNQKRWQPSHAIDNPAVDFAELCLYLFLDPNTDGDLNEDAAGNPLSPGKSGVIQSEGIEQETVADGYQITFNQYEGTFVSTDSNRQGIGVLTEAHVNNVFGDQGNWNQGGKGSDGAALSGTGITIAQVNRNAPRGGAATGKVEIKIPFADLDADAQVSDPDQPNEMIETGLDASRGVSPGDVWGFNLGQCDYSHPAVRGLNLPVWQWHDAMFFALWPHGTLTFQAPKSTAAVNEQSPSEVDQTKASVLKNHP